MAREVKSLVVREWGILIKAMNDAQLGLFRPERENDELTRSLGNPEKGGRTRGKGASVSWKKGFPQYDASYRSRQRKKDRISRVEQDLADLKNLMHEISQRPP